MEIEQKVKKEEFKGYIQLLTDIEERDFAGRYTSIEAGSFGAILDKTNISTLHDISEAQQKKLNEMLEYAEKNNHTLALIAGYPCRLRKDQFISKNPKSSLVPWEII